MATLTALSRGIAEGIAESFEGLAAIARTQAEDSFEQGRKPSGY